MRRMAFILVYNLLLHFGLSSQSVQPQVYLFLYEDCPITIYMTPHIKNLVEKYGQHIQFNYIYPNELSNYKTVVEFQKKYGLEGGTIEIDTDQSITKKLGANITPEAILVVNGKIIYKGRINDGYAGLGKRRSKVMNHDLAMVINTVLEDKETAPSTYWPPAIGCYITKKY